MIENVLFKEIHREVSSHGVRGKILSRIMNRLKERKRKRQIKNEHSKLIVGCTHDFLLFNVHMI